jgi:hypothetical protein
MLKFTRGRRELLAEKLADAANLALAAMVFGQSLASGQFSVSLAVAGLAVWGLVIGVSLLVKGRR